MEAGALPLSLSLPRSHVRSVSFSPALSLAEKKREREKELKGGTERRRRGGDGVSRLPVL
jgi:hypothetical protein